MSSTKKKKKKKKSQRFKIPDFLATLKSVKKVKTQLSIFDHALS